MVDLDSISETARNLAKTGALIGFAIFIGLVFVFALEIFFDRIVPQLYKPLVERKDEKRPLEF